MFSIYIRGRHFEVILELSDWLIGPNIEYLEASDWLTGPNFESLEASDWLTDWERGVFVYLY